MATKNRNWLAAVMTASVVIAGAFVGGYFGAGAGGGYATVHTLRVYDQARKDPRWKHEDSPAIFESPHDTLPYGLGHECHRDNWQPYGMALGSIGGAAVGGGWSLLMLRLRKSGGARILVEGTGWGILAGLVATALVHAGLIASGVDPDDSVLLAGVVLGVLAGGVTGFVCGFAAWFVISRTRELPQPSDAAPPGETAGAKPQAGQ